MGIIREGVEEHEGYTVGFVAADGCEDGSLLRELAYPRDENRRDVPVRMVAAACACGWRSPMWRPRFGTMWHPCMVFLDQSDEDRRDALWSEHADHMLELKRRGLGAHSPRDVLQLHRPR